MAAGKREGNVGYSFEAISLVSISHVTSCGLADVAAGKREGYVGYSV